MSHDRKWSTRGHMTVLPVTTRPQIQVQTKSPIVGIKLIQSHKTQRRTLSYYHPRLHLCIYKGGWAAAILDTLSWGAELWRLREFYSNKNTRVSAVMWLLFLAVDADSTSCLGERRANELINADSARQIKIQCRFSLFGVRTKRSAGLRWGGGALGPTFL